MALQTSTLKPGLLVSLKTSIDGNVSYNRIDLGTQREDETERAKWETERTISDKAEFEAAHTARGAAVSVIRRVCTQTSFGLICPESESEALSAAIIEARRIADEFNATATITRLRVYVLVARIAADDVEAVRAINAEVRDLLDSMQAGVQQLDAKKIRDAANRLRALGTSLNADAQARTQNAIDAARRFARVITKAGEQAAVEIDRQALVAITDSRTGFLDLDDDSRTVQAPVAEAVAVDFEIESDEEREQRAAMVASAAQLVRVPEL